MSKPRTNPSSAAPRRRRHTAHHTLLFGVTKSRRTVWTVIATVAVVVAIGLLVILYTDLSWEQVMATIDGLNPVAMLPLMAVLPIFGFPISVVYLFAGARFGAVGGGLVVAVITAIHLLGTYLVARSFLRAPLRRFIERRHKHLPEVPADEQTMVCVIAALVPGLPYVVRNYLLALAEVRLRTTLLVCVPIYTARSYVTILLGDMGNDPSGRKLIILVLVDVLKVVICALVIWRLRGHHRKFHRHEHEADAAHEPGAAAPPSAAGS